MDRVDVRVGDMAYPVLVGPGLLQETGRLVAERLAPQRVIVVADARVSRLYATALRRSLARADIPVAGWVLVPPGEASKTLARARRLYDAFLDARADRATPILLLGGGVVGDLGGYAASTFLRGLPVVHLPTSVLAQVDSSVGGKTGVNFARAKNLVGTFHQPRLVVADTALVSTLAEREYRAGLVEAVKIGITLRPDLFQVLESEPEAVLARDPVILARVVTACVAAKGEVVGRDEREEHVRAILNYGHTLGHALEATELGKLRHGEAVAVGMNAAAWIGERLGVTAEGVRARQNALLLALGLKLTRPGADRGGMMRNLKLDKKVKNRKIRFVLTLQVGGASVWPDIPGALLKDAVGLITSSRRLLI